MARASSRFPTLGDGLRVFRPLAEGWDLAAGARQSARPGPGEGRARRHTDGRGDRLPVGQGAETVGRGRRGFDAGKKINGTKRHIAVDTLGLLLVVIVTAANVQDRDGACRLLSLVRERFSTIEMVWADGGYAGRLLLWARKSLRLTVTVVKRNDDAKGFVVLPRRWVVERTLGWITRHRRLVRDYERLPTTHEAMVLIAMTRLMSRRLARPAVT